MRVRRYSSFDCLPPGYRPLLDSASFDSLFQSEAWFRLLGQVFAEEGRVLHLYGAENDGSANTPVALMVMGCGRLRSFGLRRVESWTNYYSLRYAPIVSPQAGPGVYGEIFRVLCHDRWDAVRLDALDPESPMFGQVMSGFQEAGMYATPFFNFGNRFEQVDGKGWEEYLSKRPSQLRNTLVRKERKLTRSGDWQFRLFPDDDLEKAIADFGSAYAGSWKKPEPDAEFIPRLAKLCAAQGKLRLGIIYITGEPAAAQIWIVEGDRATIYKLAHLSKFDAFSVGSILTMKLMRHVIEVDHVKEIDFGSGDDSYKKDWLSQRRERWGIVAYNRRRIRGMLGAVEEWGRQALKPVRATSSVPREISSVIL